jgi:ligand-binding sensor protein/AraC-like DNA-binding protein
MELAINFKDIVELSIISRFCKLFYSITGLVLDINDVDGISRRKYYSKDCENYFCRIINNTDIGKEKCDESTKEGGIKARILKRPIIYECRVGLIDIAVPIIIRGKHIGTLTTGQVLISCPTKNKFEVIKSNIKEYGIDIKELEYAYFKTPFINKKKLMNYIDLIKLIVNYIIEVEDKIIILRNENHSSLKIKVETFIENHYNEKIYIKDIANHLYISKYYFEHLFKKQTGLTFIEYLNYYRVLMAKKEISTKNITRVCYDVGFSSLSQFYKIFKRYTNTSPNKYKQNLKNLINNPK